MHLKALIFGGIIALCSGSVDIQNELNKIRTILIRHETELQVLRSENQVLHATVAKMGTEIRQLKDDGNQTSGPQGKRHVSQNEGYPLKHKISDVRTISTKKRSRMTRATSAPVAFYAYMSHNEPNPSLNHALIFDVVKTNVGGGYNEYSGMFTAPSSGVYVFTWTIYSGAHGQTKFHVYVNHDVFDSTFGETDNNQHDYDSDSGSMVVSLNASDHVYFRSAMSSSTFVLSNSNYARSTFAGWKLS